MSNNSTTVYQLGQSIWYDNIQRQLLKNGEIERMINEGKIYGITSNPSIFHNAIGKSDDYDNALIPLAQSGRDKISIYEALAIKDIQDAADLFTNVYNRTNKGDGYVSLEVNPAFANNTQATIEEAARLWEEVNRPNLMIKIPATQEGLPAITETIAKGINVNVTLIFSIERYEEVMTAYLTGLEKRAQLGAAIDHIASVASFFISRIDSAADEKLNQVIEESTDASKVEMAKSLLGKTAIANAKLAYQKFKEVFAQESFKNLENLGGSLQRPLWASTSTKNPSYPDTLYVDALIGPNTVNTVPPNTIVAFNDHGQTSATLEEEVDKAQQTLDQLEGLGISLAEITTDLEYQGVDAFKKAFEAMLETVETRAKAVA